LIISIAIGWVVTYFLSRAGLKMLGPEVAAGWRVLLALLPLLPFVCFLWAFIRVVRESDELERRIHLEALAVAFPLGVVLLMVLGLVQLALPLPPADWSYRHIWPFFFLFYFAGLGMAQRRYR
jgi:hypothetical protein